MVLRRQEWSDTWYLVWLVHTGIMLGKNRYDNTSYDCMLVLLTQDNMLILSLYYCYGNTLGQNHILDLYTIRSIDVHIQISSAHSLLLGWSNATNWLSILELVWLCHHLHAPDSCIWRATNRYIQRCGHYVPGVN